MDGPGRTTTILRGGVGNGLRFLVLASISVTLMLLDHHQQHLSRVREALSVAVYPVKVAVDFPFNVWNVVSDAITERRTLVEENIRLKREQLETSFRLQRLASLEAENARLRELLDSSSKLESRALVAEILAVDLDPYKQRFSLNRGLLDGVYVGQALLDANGLVGQIVRVGPLTAEALLISDPDHAVPVTVNRNGLRTIAVGTGDSRRLRLPYLTNNADIEVGDLLVSSGLGGVFPAGYPVGRVVEVKQQPGQSFAEVTAEPMSKLDRDREVLLVWTSAEDSPGAAAANVEVP